MVAVVMLLMTTVAVSGKKIPPIDVYLSYRSDSGFTDPSVLDTTKDLREILPNHNFDLVDSPAKADLILTVLNRDTKVDTVGSRTTIEPFGGLSANTRDVRVAERYVYIRVQAGNYDKVWSGLGRNHWRRAASGFASGLNKWCKANYDEILKLRAKKGQ